jgi:hypothetical protein
MAAKSSFSIEQQLVLTAARQWHRARQLHIPAQPHLYRRLARHGCGQLAPACDSLMTLSELVLGHPFRCGDGLVLSEDEWRLLDMMGGRERQLVHECSDALASAFRHAIRSLHIMIDMAFDIESGGPLAGAAASPGLIAA